MSKSFCFFLTSLFCLWISSFKQVGAQTADFNQTPEYLESFHTRDGLPHNTILSLHQDRRGYLWVGTYNGACRYDGFEFRTFNKELALLGINLPQAVEVIFEDRSGKIWLGSRGGLVTCFDPNTNAWRVYNANTIITAVWCIYEDRIGNIWIGTRDGYLGKLDKSRDEVVFWKVRSGDINGLIQYDSSRLLLGGAEPGLFSIRDQKYHRLDDQQASGLQTHRFLLRNEQVLTLVGTELWQIKPGHSGLIKKQLPFQVNSPVLMGKAYDPEEYVLFFGEKVIKGSLRTGVTDSFNLMRSEIRKWEVNAVLLDQNDILWLATSSGLVKIDQNKSRFRNLFSAGPNSGMSKYSRGMYYAEPHLWLGFKKARSIYLEPHARPGNFEYKTTRFLDEENRLFNSPTTNAFVKCRNGKLYSGSLEGLSLFNEKKGTFETIRPEEFSLDHRALYEIWTLYEGADGNLWIGTGKNGLYIIDPDTKKARHFIRFDGEEDSLNVPVAVWCIYEDRAKRVWLGTDNGLYSVHGAGQTLGPEDFHKQVVFGKDSINGRHVWNIYEDRQLRLWIGTTDNGLNVLDPDKSGIRHISIRDGLPSNTVSGIIEDHSGNMWVSTMNGLVRIAGGDGRIEVYTQEDGLLSNDFNFKSVSSDAHGNLYFGTKLGIVAFDPALFPPYSGEQAVPVISDFFILGEDHGNLVVSDTFELHHSQNTFQFRFSLLHFRNPDRHKFRYRLMGLEKEWNIASVKNPYAKYTRVPPGKYTLQVQASVDGINWLPTSLEKKIWIRPAFWQILWIRICALVLIGLGIAFLIHRKFRSMVRRENERAEYTRKLAELELTALQAQMNPHFIFNSLNSIQHYVLNHDEIAANDYLTRFARLMRLFLHSSKQKYISLKEEIEIIRNYIVLESLRFEEKFEYEILVAEEISDSIKIPTMILQPFIENSINHGLLEKKQGGKLKVAFTLEENQLVCRIDDNGIGREKAMLLRQSFGEHRSMGMSLIRERLKIYETMDDLNIQLTIIDKHGITGEATGTLVEMRIPLQKLKA